MTTRRNIPLGLRHSVMERDGYRCRHCGESAADTTLHIDHVSPLAAGGSNSEENLQTLCRDCNLGKSDAEPTEPSPHPRAKHSGSRRSFVANLLGVDVLRPMGESSCPDCDKPKREFWRGHVKKVLGESAILVQWYEWGFGEATYATVASLDDIRTEAWRIYTNERDFAMACRRVIVAHDHMKTYPAIHDDHAWGE